MVFAFQIQVLCIQGFLTCRKHAERIILLVEMLQVKPILAFCTPISSNIYFCFTNLVYVIYGPKGLRLIKRTILWWV